MAKKSLLILLGLISGLWLSWPGIIKSDSWSCAIKIVQKSRRNGTPTRAFLAISPKYFLSRRSYKGVIGKARIIGDACFR